jgi:hypothetical protein
MNIRTARKIRLNFSKFSNLEIKPYPDHSQVSPQSCQTTILYSFMKQMKIGKSGIIAMWHVAVFLTNAVTCANGGNQL